MKSKPLLVGMNNPQGNVPLFPHPPGCTGWRIWQMIKGQTGARRGEYMNTFDRVNLLDSPVWNARAARANREAILRQMEGRTAVLLGRAVPACLGLPATLAGVWYVTPNPDDQTKDTRWCFLPHPSGLNRWYNDPENLKMASELLSDLFTAYRHGLALSSETRRVA